MPQRFRIHSWVIFSFCIGSFFFDVAEVKAKNPAPGDNEIDRALATKHSQGTIAAMAEALAMNADASCRAQRKLSEKDFKRHAGEILKHYGRQWLAFAAQHATGEDIVRSTFAAAGDQARLAAFERLRQHPNMVAWLKAQQKYTDVSQVDDLVSRFLHYTRTVKLSIKDFSYLGTGQDRMEDLRITIEKEVEEASRTARPQLEELEQLLAPHLPAIQAKQKERDAVVGDYKVFAGVESRLQTICITPRS